MDPGAQISAVMVSYRTGPVLFESIRAVLADPDIRELILVNHDNPTNVTVRLDTLDAAEPRLRVIHTGENLGFARGCNIGARAASGNLLLFLNPDTLIGRGTAALMANTVKDLDVPAIAGARILNPDGSEQRGARRGDLTLMSAALSFSGLARLLPGLRDFHRERETVPSTAVEVPSVSGAAMMMTRASYRRLNGFDERYFLHVEDLDICKRTWRAGGKVVFEPRASLVHLGSTSHVNVLFVEWHKAAGLRRYFAAHATTLERWVLWLVNPLMTLAILARAVTLRTRTRVIEARQRMRARARLAQRRRDAGNS